MARWTPVDVESLSDGSQGISAGDAHTCAVSESGALHCWGDNHAGQLGNGTQVDRLTPVTVTGMESGAQMVSARGEHTCALTASGGVKCWGNNDWGQLGDGTNAWRLTPVDVSGLSAGAATVSSGDWHTCTLTATGGAKCWGHNIDGRVGDGTTNGRWLPVDVVGLSTGVQALSAGQWHTCALTTAGDVKCWGWNEDGQVGDGTTRTRLTPVDVWNLDYDCAAATEIPQPECNALVTFFEATNGPFWRDHTGWLRTATPCSWQGIACESGQISQLNLSANNLVDALPTALGDLAGLQRLVLRGNNLTGALPVALGNLAALQYLDLSANQLTGALPLTLSNLRALQTLDLHGNALTGPLPGELGALTELLTLDLSANALSGPVPVELGALVMLRTLDLHANQLTGSLPAALGRLAAVQTLDLSRNALSGEIPPTLGDATALRTLDLSHNALSGPLPWSLSALTALERLNLAHNRLTGELPREWSLLAALQHLDLSYNALSGWLPPEYDQLTTLRALDLSFNELRGPLPATWGNLRLLQTLSLNNNQLAGPIPAAWGALGSAATYEVWPPLPPQSAWWNRPPPGMYLDLSCNRLSGELPVTLGRIHGLVALNVASNQLRGRVPEEFGHEDAPYIDSEDNRLAWIDGTQVLPPTTVRAAFSSPNSVTLTWTPIVYYWSFESYEISSATTPAGPFTVQGQAAGGGDTYTVTGLTPSGRYYFRLRTFSPAHESQSPGWGAIFEHAYVQQSNLWSDYTPVVCVNCAPLLQRRWLPLIGGAGG